MTSTSELVASFVLSYDYATDLMIEYMLDKNENIKINLLRLMKTINEIIKISISINIPTAIISDMIRGNKIIIEYLKI